MSQPPQSHDDLLLPILSMNMRLALSLQIEDIDMLRYDVMDAIGDCCRVMGATMCLTLFVRALEMEMQSFVALPPDAQVS